MANEGAQGPGKEVFLNAGDFYFYCKPPEDRPNLRVRTLLGSCVSIILWNPVRRAGGMCHFILPSSGSGKPLDGRHCEGAIQMFRREVERIGTHPRQYKVYLAGGGRMSMGQRRSEEASVGARNIECARKLLAEQGFTITAEHVGQTGHRRVIFDLDTGRVSVSFGSQTHHLS